MSTVFQDPTLVTTVGEFFRAGGLMMWPILGCSVVTVGLAFERYLHLRRGRVLPRVVVDAVGQIAEGRAEVIAAGIQEAEAPAARVLAAGLRRRGYPLVDVERAMSDQLAKEAARLRGNIRGISLMAAVAPLCGLLGTVLGIARAFSAIEKTGLDRSETLAAGIGVALYTTIFGLAVAIPATLLSAHLQGRVRRTLTAMDSALTPAIEPLAAAGGAAAARPARGPEDSTHAA
ncbi:MAG: MotA/TolQ/ExbB proton channel family protein [Pirellulales bacterium]